MQVDDITYDIDGGPSVTITNVNFSDLGLSCGDTVHYPDTDTPMGVVTEVHADGSATVLLQGAYTTPEPNRNNRTYPYIVPDMNTTISAATVNGPYLNNTDLVIGTPSHPEFIKLCDNGDIIIKGHKIENDICLVDAMRDFLSGQGLYNR